MIQKLNYGKYKSKTKHSKIKSNQLKGGVSDKISPKKFYAPDVNKGAKIEKEHSNDKQIQKEIARDHIYEHGYIGNDNKIHDKGYYDNLKVMERVLKTK